jgi:hypothetical protein
VTGCATSAAEIYFGKFCANTDPGKRALALRFKLCSRCLFQRISISVARDPPTLPARSSLACVTPSGAGSEPFTTRALQQVALCLLRGVDAYWKAVVQSRVLGGASSGVRAPVRAIKANSALRA